MYEFYDFIFFLWGDFDLLVEATCRFFYLIYYSYLFMSYSCSAFLLFSSSFFIRSNLFYFSNNTKDLLTNLSMSKLLWDKYELLHYFSELETLFDFFYVFSIFCEFIWACEVITFFFLLFNGCELIFFNAFWSSYSDSLYCITFFAFIFFSLFEQILQY